MGIADLSVLPRTGFKGTGTIEWLAGQGLTIGADSNMAYRQEGGELAARLAPSEIFLIDGLAATGALVEKLNSAWAWGTEKPRKLIGYPMPRQDSHAWFMVTGTRGAGDVRQDLRHRSPAAQIRDRPDRPDLARQDERHRHPRQIAARCRPSTCWPTSPRRSISGAPCSTPWRSSRARRSASRHSATSAEAAMARAPKAFEMQDPHSLAGKREGNLEIAIGREVREFRRKLDMTVAELARLAGMSAGMLSKIENGMTSPSLDTLKSLSTALHVPVTAFFRRYEEERDATFVKAGQGTRISSAGGPGPAINTSSSAIRSAGPWRSSPISSP